jgi:hypothetical protein
MGLLGQSGSCLGVFWVAAALLTALAANGRAKSVRASRSTFSLGYAKPSRRLRRKWLDTSVEARARRGIPIGARVFGHVRSKAPGAPVPGDSDLDGVPDPLDIDDDDDLILDNLDRSSEPRASQKKGGKTPNPGDQFVIHSLTGGTLNQTANANAAALTTEQVDAALHQGDPQDRLRPRATHRSWIAEASSTARAAARAASLRPGRPSRTAAMPTVTASGRFSRWQASPTR